MAATLRNLSVLAYAQGFTLWVYRTPDTLDLVQAPNYFSATTAAGLFTTGDMVLVSAPGAGALLLVAATEPAIILAPLSSADSQNPERIAA